MEKIEERFLLVQSSLSYLDLSDSLLYVKTACLKYNKGEELLVYHFRIQVDPADIAELNAALGNLIVLKPLEASDVFQEVVFQAAQELQLLPGDTTLSQIAVDFKLTSLPNPLQSCIIRGVKDLSRNVGRSYVKLNGIVIGVTGITRYTQSTKYVCPFTQCEGNEGNKFIRIHIAGSTERQTIRNDFRCTVCGSVLEEHKGSRILSDRLLAEILPESCFEDSVTVNGCDRIQAVPVCLRDELCEDVQIGQKYHVIGIVRKDVEGETVSLALEANNLCKLPWNYHLSLQSSLPPSIAHLLEDRRDSPWSFALSLAYVFGGEVSPPGSYVMLKLGLLISLAAAVIEKPFHLLAVGSETETLRKLLDYSHQFSERRVSHTTGFHLAGKVIKDRYETAPYYLEAGSLLLAAGGVCCVGDMSRLKKKDMELLQAVLGSNKVFLDLGPKHTGGLPQQTVHPLTCQIWAYSDYVPTKSTKNSADPFLQQELGNIPKKILDVFGCVYFLDRDDGLTKEEIDEQTTYQILQQAMEQGEQSYRLPISARDFKQMFQYLSNVRPRMTDRALQLLQAYFLASRKARSDSVGGVPVGGIQTLVSLAYGHAVLNVHTEVLEEDAVMAVRIYEENITARFGSSVLNVQPTTHVLGEQFEDFVGLENDKAMQRFHVQVLRFCGAASNIEE